MTQIANKHGYESWGELMYDTHEYLQIECVKEAMEEYRSNLWTSPCTCTNDEKHGETWCCNLCGKPTARTESKELPGDFFDYYMEDDSLVITDSALDGYEAGFNKMRSLASPLLAYRDARIRELEEQVEALKHIGK
jgi:hypothetical protein